MPRIYLTHAPEALDTYFGDAAVTALRELGELVFNPHGRNTTTDEMIEAAKDCEFIVSFRADHGPAAVFEKSPNLVAFLRHAVDIRDVDVEAASANGVLVCNAGPHFTAATAEIALGLMIAAGRDIGDSVAAYRAGREPESPMGMQLEGRTAGIIGFGRIARHLHKILVACGMRVLVHLPTRRITEETVEQVDLDTLLAESDYVLPLAVAIPATENLMNAETFGKMRDGAVFVNVSRGDLVDEDAMLAAYRAGRIRAIGMDVGRAKDQRPTPAIAALPRVVAAPHLGGAVPENVFGQAMDAVKQLRFILNGEMPPLAVNPEQAHRVRKYLKNG